MRLFDGNKLRTKGCFFGIHACITLGLLVFSLGQLEIIADLQAQLDAREPVIIYNVDNVGAELVGKITAKEVIEGKYTVEAGPYGKFLVSKEIYDSIEVGDDIPEILKGVSK